MRSYHIDIVTPDSLAFSGEIESLLVRTDDGDVEILANHADFVASLGTGKARITVGGEKRYAACSGGFLTVASGKVKLIAVTFEFAENIDSKRAAASKEKAEALLSSAKDEKAITAAKAKLHRALNRINVAEMR